ncbi:MAG: S41 family peptidase [Bacteroidales bacterium]|jgi:Tol biopolymer transport system component/C-terminal processing protease CtpA/Prc|nr:S41 family peptidase [Bacteroidales bacterium]
MRKFILIALAVISGSYLASAQETPMWLRKNAISPDGSKIAFEYQGDIFVVNSEGGKALQVTSNEAYDSDPLWTGDGKKIVFSSYREGSKDIYITDAEGGTPKRLTTYAGNETPMAVLRNGSVIFSCNIQDDPGYGGFPGMPQLYSVDTSGSRPVLVTSLVICNLSVNNKGNVIYEDYKGYEDPFRKHHTSSVTRDIWEYTGAAEKDAAPGFSINGKGTFKKLSSYVGEDRNPVFAEDGNTFYYLSERDGKTSNIYKSSISDPDKNVQLTFETKNPVRYLSISDNGTLAYSYNGELYTLKKNGKPVKVAISIATDQIEKEMNRLTFIGGASSMDVSPDGKEVAVVVRGDVFVTSADYSTTNRITNTPEQERDVCFSKDGRSLYYSSERNGFWGIYKMSLTDKDEKYFTYSYKMKEELFSDPGETSYQPAISPDGKWLAYLRDRTELVIKPAKGGKVKSLLKGANYSYLDGDQSFSWSPDSRYILSNYQAHGGWNNTDVALINIENGEITDLTRSGYSDENFKWALGGKAMTWESDKNGYRSHGSWGSESDIYIMFFDGKTMSEFFRDKEDDEIAKLISEDHKGKKDDGKKEKKDSTKQKVEKLDLDLVNRENRIFRLTKYSSMLGDHYLTNDGKKLFYITPLEDGKGLCELDIKKKSIKVLQHHVYGSITPSKDGKYIYIFTGASIKKMPVAGGATKSISFSGSYEFKPKAERAYIFEHIWKQVKEKFYDPDLHGIDWDYYKQNYERFLPYINNYFDFQELLSEMLGELNGSHTGARYYNRNSVSIGHLGVIYDDTYDGDGLKIKEVLPDGVLNLADPDIKSGDIITAINGQEIKAGKDWFSLLIDTKGKKTMLTVKKGGKKAVDIFVEPSYSDASLLYKRWVRQREELVTKLSGGKIGYVHIEAMDSPSFRELYSKALGKYRNCDAIIVDTRHNGGGWLHDDLVTFLNGKAYIKFEPRGQYIGTEPYNKWTKPSCVLVSEDNYSDASGFPYIYQNLGVGKLIGAPVPGTMTAVWWENQINRSIVFGIPEIGSYGIKAGRYLENLQIEPDILVYDDPASLLNGEDKQLEAAVKEMLKETESK